MLQNSAHQDVASAPRTPLVWIAVAGLALVAFGAASLLWIKYGTAVFFGMIASGIAACF